MDRKQLKQVSEFKYLRCILNESGTDGAECRRKVDSEGKVAGAIRSLVYAKGLQLKCVRVLPEGLAMPFLLYGSDSDIERKGEVYD